MFSVRLFCPPPLSAAPGATVPPLPSPVSYATADSIALRGPTCACGYYRRTATATHYAL